MISQVEGGVIVMALAHFSNLLSASSRRVVALARLQMERILPYTELTAFLLAVNFVGRISPEVFLHPAVEAEASNIDSFVKAIGKGGDDPSSALCYAGITRHPAARLVSWQALPLLSTIGYRVACPTDVRWSAITVNEELIPEPGAIDSLVVTVLTEYVASCYSLLDRTQKEEVAASSYLDAVTKGLREDAGDEP